MKDLPNPIDVVQARVEDDAAWLDSALAATQKPTSFKQRQWVQLMLIDRYSQQFRTTKLEALRRVADRFAQKFPN